MRLRVPADRDSGAQRPGRKTRARRQLDNAPPGAGPATGDRPVLRRRQRSHRNQCTAVPGRWASAPAHHSEHIANIQAAGEMPHGEGAWPVSWIPSSSRAARPPGMRPLGAPVRRRPAGGCGPAPASGIQPSGMHPPPGPGRARVRRRRPAPSLRGPRSRAGSYLWPVREPRRTGGRCPATAAPGHAPVPGGRASLRGAASYKAEG